MSIPAPNLDDLRFQRDLVDEARKRIIRYCPEWTEYNLSDPGITLIELFAWMTEMILYRLNQVPEKNYLKFLELLGIQRRPASSARADLTFWLSVPLPISPENEEAVIVPQGIQVMARNTGEGEPVIFTTDRKLTVVPPRLTQLRREEDFHKNYLPRLGIEAFYAFSQSRPQPGDTFYLGFDEARDISAHLLRLNFQCRQTEAVGVRRDDPPWVWECSLGNGLWQEITPSSSPGEKDTTGGLNNANGSLVLYLPMDMRPDEVYGRSASWVRCRLEQRRPEQGMYSESPRITSVQTFTIGASVPATHAVVAEDVMLGRSNGDPGQTFFLEHTPILDLQDGEQVEVEEVQFGELVFVPWKHTDSFAHADRYERCFVLDTASGEVKFGPAVRQADGTVQQYGRVPETNRQVRFTRYRYGGGARGNVPANAIQVMTTSLAYIARVSNLRRSRGGMDPETLDEVKLRAQRELQAQMRAVTAEDYELLAKAATASVARARCITPQQHQPGRQTPALPSGVVRLLIVPAVGDSLRARDLTALHLDETLAGKVASYLDRYRLLTAILRVEEPSYLGVKVRARVVTSEFQRPEVVRANALDTLRAFISPLKLENNPAVGAETSSGSEIIGNYSLPEEITGPEWEGWPFGRNLYLAEVFSLLQRVPGIRHVLEVELFTREVDPRQELSPEEAVAASATKPDDETAPTEKITEPDDKSLEGLEKVTGSLVRITPDTLLCSLEHEIVIASLDEIDGQE
ncbi:MAG: putative baseplate assembly protein [Anaerolineales bacterium]|nr:putative baseplate assembly protein [Anaerolineales bacterium]